MAEFAIWVLLTSKGRITIESYSSTLPCASIHLFATLLCNVLLCNVLYNARCYKFIITTPSFFGIIL